MNRRDFMRGVAAGLSVTHIPTLAVADEVIANSPRAWLKNSPTVAVGSWDDMPIFVRRVGGQATWEEASYRREHTEETVRRLKDLGATIAIIDFFKGFGLEAEKDHIDDAQQLAALLHHHDIRVGLYVGSTIAYETFLLEQPEAQEWFVPDYLGRPAIYPDQTFRKRVYFMHPGYVDYMKRVVRMGVADLKADLIHFDNTSLQARPEVFQHPLAINDFREYLKAGYDKAELKNRLGFSNVEYVLPPIIDWPLTIINDPLFQLWTDFRCHQLNRYYDEMQGFIRNLDPAVIMDCNPSSGMGGTNTIWEQGISYPGLYPHVDMSWTEEGNYASVTSQGVLVSKIRTYKAGSILNTQIITYTAGTGHYGGEGGGTLAMAESLAFNRQSLGMVGGILEAPNLPEDQKEYIQFFRQAFDYYKDVQSVADVAVLYSYASMGFNNDRPAVSFMLFTQALIQGRAPFEIIFDEHLKDLSKYRVLALADQECLDDDQIELIRQYVKEGGGLVATEQSSLYTARRLRRPDFGLKDLFNVSAPPWRGAGRPETDLDIGPVRNHIGQSRCSYIPKLKPAIEKPPGARMTSQYWKLPLNWEEMIEQVRWAAGGKFTLEVEAQDNLAVVAELQDQAAQGRRLVHLLNYAAARGATVSSVQVHLKLPEGKTVQQVTLLTPEGTGSATMIPSHIAGGQLHFTVPHLNTYTLAVVQMA
ncbi:MAG TPA: hypothetical protein VMI06_13270 [Terriglobia bacterium]|nr:hypothetical protein [Terriglobia bacterium]